MKRFCINGISFILIAFAILVGLDLLSMHGSFRQLFANWTDSASYFGGGPDEIKPYIAKVQSQDGTTKLIIGDSVCYQMFNGLQEYNPDFTIIGSNGAITMAGQYILTKEYLDNHSNATDVFLIVLPESLGRTFDTRWGYQYSVMPFVDTDTIHNLDGNTLKVLSDTYGKIFLNKKVVRSLYLSAVNRKIYLNYIANRTAGYVLSNYFELSDQYVVKMAELCGNKGVSFHLYPCPVCEIREELIDSINDAFIESKTYNINPQFIEMVQYYPAEQASDGIHFSGEYVNQDLLNEKIQQLYSNEILLDYLKFD